MPALGGYSCAKSRQTREPGLPAILSRVRFSDPLHPALEGGQAQPGQGSRRQGPLQGSGCQKEPGCPLRRAAKGWEFQGRRANGLPCVPPSVGPGGEDSTRPSCPHPLLTSARRAQCFLQADPSLLFLCSGISSHPISIFTLWPGEGLAFPGVSGRGAGWAAQLHFWNLTTLPPPRLHLGLRSLKGSPPHPGHRLGQGAVGHCIWAGSAASRVLGRAWASTVTQARDECSGTRCLG